LLFKLNKGFNHAAIRRVVKRWPQGNFINGFPALHDSINNCLLVASNFQPNNGALIFFDGIQNQCFE
jgi:hypothetical protein